MDLLDSPSSSQPPPKYSRLAFRLAVVLELLVVSVWVWKDDVRRAPGQTEVDADLHQLLLGKKGRALHVVVSLSIAICISEFLADGVLGLITFLGCAIPVGIVILGWHRMGRPYGVEPRFLAAFGLQTSVCGILVASFLESGLCGLWEHSFAGCDLGLTPPARITWRRPQCAIASALGFILGVGVVEETFKAIWLLYRLRRSVEDVPETRCFELCKTHEPCCRWYYKLAPTPYHVILAALAAGAGFEFVENLGYTLQAGNPAMSSLVALTRGVMPLHICWTGAVGMGLAQRMFLPQDQQPGILRILMLPVCLHGLIDYSLVMLGSVHDDIGEVFHQDVDTVGDASDFAVTHADSEMNDAEETVISCMFCVFLGVFIGTILLGAKATGCRFNLSRCCCSPGFWEADYGPWSGSLQEPLRPDAGVGEAIRAG